MSQSETQIARRPVIYQILHAKMRMDDKRRQLALRRLTKLDQFGLLDRKCKHLWLSLDGPYRRALISSNRSHFHFWLSITHDYHV